jgi:hypothetical protein
MIFSVFEKVQNGRCTDMQFMEDPLQSRLRSGPEEAGLSKSDPEGTEVAIWIANGSKSL